MDSPNKRTRTTSPKGTTGQACTLVTNHFQIELDAKLNPKIYQYAVSVEPEVFGRKRAGLLGSHLKDDDGEPVLFSLSGEVLFTKQALPETTFDVENKHNSEEKFHFDLKLVKELDFENKDHLSELFRLYNVIFNNKCLRQLNLQRFGRNFYDAKQSIDLGPKLMMQLWPGFFSAISIREGGPTLNLDIAYKSIRKEHCANVIEKIKSGRYGDEEEERRISDALIGQTVVTEYNNRHYRISNVSFDKKTNEFSFSKRKKNEDGTMGEEQCRLIDYYRQAYNLHVKMLEYPLLEVQEKAGRDGKVPGPIYLVPEFCLLTGIADEVFNDINKMKDVHRHTRPEISKRVNNMKTFAAKFVPPNGEASKHLSEWGIRFSADLMRVSARKLPAITIQFKDNKTVPRNGDWRQYYSLKTRFFQEVNVNRMVLYYPRRLEAATQACCKRLAELGKPLGVTLNFQTAKKVQFLGDDPEKLVMTLQDTKPPAGAQLVIAVIPQQKKQVPKYNALKKHLVCEAGVPSQLVLAKTVEMKKDSMLTGVVQQICAKMQGAPWSVNDLYPTGDNKPTVVIGVDVSHVKKRGIKSISGWTASMNKDFSSFYSAAAKQEYEGDDIITKFNKFLQNTLNKFKAKNGVLPERIIVYRDGVGEGQLGALRKNEIPQFQAAIKEFGTYSPEFIHIVVSKRINTRFFEMKGNTYTNPPGGTIIDTGVTENPKNPDSSEHDFYLISQNVRQGSVNPTHYQVMKNTSSWSVNDVQLFTWKLCHLYYNFTATISCPTPVYYAHKLAFLLAQSTDGELPHKNLSDSLFFL